MFLKICICTFTLKYFSKNNKQTKSKNSENFISVFLFILLSNLAYGPLTLIQQRSGKSLNYQGPFGFDLTFTRCKLASPGFGTFVIERCGFGNLPRMVRQHYYAEKEQVTGLTENPPPPALYTAQDHKLIGMLTDATSHC